MPPVPHLEVSGTANPTRVEGWLIILAMGELRTTARMPRNQIGRPSPALMARKLADSTRGDGTKGTIRKVKKKSSE